MAGRAAAPAALALAAAGLAACTYTAAPLTPAATGSDMEMISRAADYGLPKPLPLPPRGEIDLVLEGGEALDHEARMLAISCSAYDYLSKLQAPVVSYLKALDVNGDLDEEPAGASSAPAATVRIEDTKTFVRCVEVESWQQHCRVNTTIAGEITAPGEEAMPIKVQTEETAHLSIALSCQTVGNALAVVNLHSAGNFVQEVRSRLGTGTAGVL